MRVVYIRWREVLRLSGSLHALLFVWRSGVCRRIGGRAGVSIIFRVPRFAHVLLPRRSFRRVGGRTVYRFRTANGRIGVDLVVRTRFSNIGVSIRTNETLIRATSRSSHFARRVHRRYIHSVPSKTTGCESRFSLAGSAPRFALGEEVRAVLRVIPRQSSFEMVDARASLSRAELTIPSSSRRGSARPDT